MPLGRDTAGMPTRLAEGLWWFDLGSVNAFLVEDGDDLVLVDAGTPRAADRLRRGLDDLGFSPGDVDRVLLTHYDYDHVGGLAKLTPALDAPVVAMEPDAGVVAGERSPPWANHKGALQRVAGLLLELPDLPVQRVAAGEMVGSFTAYHTPGHTPGHAVFVSEVRDVAFLGDLVRSTDGELAPSPWFISYDADAVEASIRTLVDRTPRFAVACPGHGVPMRSGGFDALAALA